MSEWHILGCFAGGSWEVDGSFGMAGEELGVSGWESEDSVGEAGDSG